MTGARATNYGTRIDYIFADIELAKKGFTDCMICPDVEGSDHCPVKAVIHWDIVPATRCPALCTKFMPEFTGTQQKLSSFFYKAPLKKSASDCEETTITSIRDSRVNSDTDKPILKRTVSSKIGQPKLKKQKSDVKKTSNKQQSLLNFFGKQLSEGSNSNTASQSKLNTSCTTEPAQLSPEALQNTSKLGRSSKTNDQSQSWKSFFQRPAPVPLCKGHGEACVLRTVKKDSLNKGRQFYVCCRPEGHKSNPDARCDHFEWVERKKKTGK